MAETDPCPAPPLEQPSGPLHPGYLGLSIVMTLLSIASVSVRLWLKSQLRRTLDLSDILLTLAALSCTANWVNFMYWEFATNKLRPECSLDASTIGIELFFSYALWVISVYSCKLGIVHMIHGILESDTRPIQKLITKIVGGIVLSCGLASFIGLFFTLPVTLLAPSQHIWTAREYALFLDFQKFVDAADVATDFMVWFLPFRSIRALDIPLKMKIALVAAFGVGFGACSITVIRVSFDWIPNKYTTVLGWVLSAVETSTGIIAACSELLFRVPRCFAMFLVWSGDKAGLQYEEYGANTRDHGENSLQYLREEFVGDSVDLPQRSYSGPSRIPFVNGQTFHYKTPEEFRKIR